MNIRSRFSAALLAGALLLGTSACGTQGTASFASPVELTVWTYYNGDQLDSFNRLVEEFNDTVGRERNIEVIASGQGSVNDLETNVMNAAEGKVGAEALPNIFSAYADTAYAIDRMGLVVDLTPYLDEKEREKYIEAYLEEGDFDGDGSIKIFPTAKCTELMFLNDTDWQKFAQAAGADYSDLSTVEGVVRTAEKYYDWTDAQTDAPDDGRALFGRDAMANYILAGAKELGAPIFRAKNGRMTLNFDRDAVRRLWDNYYVPFIKGYFSASGRFRSDEIKSGDLLAYVGSNASATFLPTQVIRDDGQSYSITMRALPCPTFEGCEPVAVQQGAGMVVTRGTDEQIEASVEFLKWITEPENNISFSVGSGYLLGAPIFRAKNGRMTLNFDRDAVRRLWDNYYVPFIKGYFSASGRFRSDEIKSGDLLAYVGSNASATFLPTQVIRDDGQSYSITMRALPCPTFEGCEPVAVQQGAGMVVTRGTDEQIEASVEFLKWITEPENNISFSVGSGYLPVTHAACDMDAIEQSGLPLSGSMKEILSTAIDTVDSCELYTMPAFTGAKDARSILESCMSDRASADRRTVEERLAAGQSAADAEAEFLTDGCFENWYNETLEKLRSCEG